MDLGDNQRTKKSAMREGDFWYRFILRAFLILLNVLPNNLTHVVVP